ncbi:MAG: hypothetical protein M1347_07020 [Chloroflexi bacterium]|nr:hypothetical protein [Chloroflexota bacterium]
MAQRTTFSYETVLYLLILLMAFVLRFADLGAAPLTEFEAQAALPAHSLANSESPDLGDQPAYVLLTGPLFSLLGSSEFFARLWPALFGLALVALPYFWRDLLGPKVALILSAAIALDAGLVAVSRLASGQMIAVSAALIALTAWRNSRPGVAGVFVSIAFLASPLIFFGLFPAFLVWLTIRPLQRLTSDRGQPFLISIVMTLVLGGTLFLQVPGGLGGLGDTLTSFMAGFARPGVAVAEIGLAMLGYVLPALVLGLIGAVNAWSRNQSIGKLISLFALFSLLFVLVTPGRQVADLLWTILTLWMLAAMQVASYLSLPERDLNVALGEMGLMILLGFFFGIALTKLGANYTDFTLVAAATLLLAILATILIAFGWSRPAAAQGFVWAGLLFSALFMLSASSRFLRVETTDANDLWAPGPAAGSSRLLSASLHDLSVFDQGVGSELAVELRSDNAALAWALRNLRPAESGAGAPPLIITPASDVQPEEFAAYRGQSFAVRVQRAWTGWPPNFFAWLFYRQAPTQTEEIILWARGDLFPDGQPLSESEREPSP